MRNTLFLSSVAVCLSLAGCGGDDFTEQPTGSGGGGAGGTGGSAGDGGMGAGGGAGGGGMGGAGAMGGTGGTGGDPCPDNDMDGADCNTDCDDTNPDAFPGNPEKCGDLIDNDCVGGADDTCGGLGTYVSETGDDNNTGTQQFPVRTIYQGIQNALTIGGGVDVYVDKGDYPEQDPINVGIGVWLEEGVSIFGGYDMQDGWSRDPANNISVISAVTSIGVYAHGFITRATLVDGFTINGVDSNAFNQSIAIQLDGGSPTITNNRINGGDTTDKPSKAIRVNAPSNSVFGALIAGNVITLGTATDGNMNGIILESVNNPPPLPGAIAEIRGNTITGGAGENVNSIAVWAGGSSTLVEDNDITAGSANGGQSWGIALGRPSGQFVINANRVNVDQANVGHCTNGGANTWCGGIISYSGAAVMTNNVSFGVEAPRSAGAAVFEVEGPIGQMVLNGNLFDGGGKLTATAGTRSAALMLRTYQGVGSLVGRIRNNILLGGSNETGYGVYEDIDSNNLARNARPEYFTNNLFFDTDVMYRDYDGVNATDINDIAIINGLTNIKAANNIAADPMLGLGYHVNIGSPCIDAGTSLEAPTEDFEGDGRPMGAAVDIGPDEAQ